MMCLSVGNSVRPTETARSLLLGSTIVIAALLMSAGAAFAQRCEAPPGTSGTDQYCETLPGAKGDRGSGTGPRLSGSVDRGTSKTLERYGSDGQGVLALPSNGKRVERDKLEKGAVRADRSASPADPSGSPLGALGSAIESGPGAGGGFLWLLAATGIGMVGIAWMRYRRRSEP